jgi:hypothetical protein
MSNQLTSSSPDTRERIATSVKFTEEYKDRVKGLLADSAQPTRPTLFPQPVRGILLQDVWGGQDGAMQLIGRDGTNKAFIVEIVGKNYNPTENTFQLQLSGQKYVPNSSVLSDPVVIGTSNKINCVASNFEVMDALFAIAPKVLNCTNVFVGLGNPIYARELEVYGKVKPATERLPQSYLLGLWHIFIPAACFADFAVLTLATVKPSITGLTQVRTRSCLDLLSPEITVVTDMDYRTEAYPWQAGTIATCLDFSDIGYGIIRSTSRNLEIV